jgi:hypothetical protein
MPSQIVMDATGDTRHEFDVKDEAAVAEARKRFQELTRLASSRRSEQASGGRN